MGKLDFGGYMCGAFPLKKSCKRLSGVFGSLLRLPRPFSRCESALGGDIDKVVKIAQGGQNASKMLSVLDSRSKNSILLEISRLLREKSAEVLGKNGEDLLAMKSRSDLNRSFLDRAKLTSERLESIAKGVEDVATLEDPCQRVLESRVVPHNGLKIDKISCPIGTLAIIYESRPNVTIDAAVLSIKSGNACILKGGRDVILTNKILTDIVREAIVSAGFPDLVNSVNYLDITNRKDLRFLLGCSDFIDLVIPRGGRGLIEFVLEYTKIPILNHLDGNCHTYIEKSAPLDKASLVLSNAKMRRVSLCNATESLVVDREFAHKNLRTLVNALSDAGCKEFVGDEESVAIDDRISLANDGEFFEEFLSEKISVKIVQDYREAILHVNKHCSGHTEAIVSENKEAIDAFARKVWSSSVMVNASTQFSDGFEFGLGAEIGISNGKMHARGPIGLRELNTYKYIVTGDYAIRK